MASYRIGIDFGGTKIEAAVLGADGRVLWRERAPTPIEYGRALTTIAELVAAADREGGERPRVGVGIPGRIEPASGLVNSGNCLNGHPFAADLAATLGREVAVTNDACCFALSEAQDGAGAGADVVFGVILGTGCGGGIVVRGKLLQGPNGIASEWGHSPYAFATSEELQLARRCWCGRLGCQETVLSGVGLAVDCDGAGAHDASAIPERAAQGEQRAVAALARHAERLGRALAAVVNLIDPDVIVLGGGLSNMPHLYEQVPPVMARHVFGGACRTRLVRNVHGDSSGVRGAAWLWPL
jgi:fructokinase